jgi:hypothetical protein
MIPMQFVRATSTAALFLLFGAFVPAYAQHDQQGEGKGKPEKRQGSQQRGSPPGQQQRSQGQQRVQQNQQQQQRVQQNQQNQQQQRVRQDQQQNQQQRVRQDQQQQVQQQRVQQTQRPQQRQQEQRSQNARQQQQPQRNQQQAAAWQQQRGWLRQGGGWREQSTWQQGRAQRWDSDHRSWAQRGGYGGYYIPQDRFSLYFGIRHGFRMHSRPTMYMGYPRFSYGGFSFILVDPWPEYWADNWYGTDDLYIDYDDGYYLYNRRHPGIGLAITVVL